MEITLNSPKYAEAQSLQYQMYKKQKDRKKRKNFTPELFERYYRRNEGTTDYATIPEVALAGDFVIEFDVLTSMTGGLGVVIGNNSNTSSFILINGSTGTITARFVGASDLTGSMPVNDGRFHSVIISVSSGVLSIVIDGALDSSKAIGAGSSVLDSLYKNTFGNNLSGILANLKIWDNGTLIRDYPLDDNSDTLRDRANGQNGTVINGNASDWGLFQQQATGEWLGQELVVNGGFDNGLTGWSSSNAVVNAGVLGFTASGFAFQDFLGLAGRVVRASANYVGGSTPQIPIGDSVAPDIGSGNSRFQFNGTIGDTIDNVSVKEVLHVA